MDKIDAYDKEQLQGMDWLFDETQASDSGTLLVGEYIAATPISKGQLVVCQQNAKVAYVLNAGDVELAFDQAAFAVAQSDAAENEPVDVMMYGGTFEATGVTGSGVELYAVCHMEQDVYTASAVLYFDHLTFDTPEPLPSYPKGTVAIAVGNKQGTDGTGTTVTMYNQSKYFYVMNYFGETLLVDLANPVNVYWIGQLLGTSVEFGTAMGDNKGLQDTLSSSSDFGTKLAASVAFVNALVNNSTFQTGLASKDTFGTQLGVNTGLAPVRTVKQTLTNEQKQTAWGNIGLNVYIIDQSKFGTALTDAELAAYNAAEAILVTNHQKYVSALYLLASNSGGNAMFYSIVDSSTFMRIRIDDPNTILNETSVLSDQNAIKFNVNQSLSIAQSNHAIGNIGTGFYIVPYGGTVPAADLERAVGASALILTNTPSEGMPKIYMRSSIASNGNIYFYAFASAYDVVSVNLNPTTGVVSNAAYTKVTAGLLSYSSVQNLSIDDTNRVMSNIGLDITVVNLTKGSATLTQERADALLASNGVIFTGSGMNAVHTGRIKNRIFFRSESSFYAVYNSAYVMYAVYNPDTGVITVRDIVGITDPISVHFTAQTLTEAQQARARENIGITQGLLNDADFIAELKTKLGLT
ncbi:hypothetical protein [Alistipes putredinis]|uniref:hypothetical protein n=1 Tax=Alistipes putredinis TaxID=28117 RepID=UPI003A8C75B1